MGDSSDFTWPPPSAITGIPASILRRLTRPLIFDTFQGSETAARSADQWVDNTVGTGVVAQGFNPSAGDVVTTGIVRCIATLDPVAPSAARKGGVNSIAVNGFGAAPRMMAVRIKNQTVAAPAVAQYSLSLCEVTRRAATELPPTEGIEIVFDPTLGFESYLVRSWVAGAATDDTQQLLAHDTDFHVIGFLVDVDGVTPFVDGVEFDRFSPVLIQPAVECSMKFADVFVTVGGTVTATVDTDWACYS